MSEEQRFRWVERLFWDLNFLPQMGQSGTPGGGGGGGGGAGARSSLSSKHLRMKNVLLLSVRQEVNSAHQSSRQMSVEVLSHPRSTAVASACIKVLHQFC